MAPHASNVQVPEGCVTPKKPWKGKTEMIAVSICANTVSLISRNLLMILGILGLQIAPLISVFAPGPWKL